jgi:DNA mismatch repair ATPase MutL
LCQTKRGFELGKIGFCAGTKVFENSGYFEKKYALPSLIRNIAPGKKSKINKRTPMFIPESRVVGSLLLHGLILEYFKEHKNDSSQKISLLIYRTTPNIIKFNFTTTKYLVNFTYQKVIISLVISSDLS